MRSKSILLLAVALGCGLVASIGISQLMDTRSQSADVGERQPVYVAMADINAADELTAQNVKVEEWPKAITPAGALTKLEDVEGKRCRVKIYAGEPILASKLLGADETLGAAKEIPAGYRVAHVTVDGAVGSNNLILPGDRVDVLVFRNTSANDMHATASKIVLQDIKVFAVNTHTETEFSQTKADQNEPITARTIALLVTPRQAEILHAATEMAGAIRLVLRNPDDDSHYVSEGATISDIFGPEDKTGRDSEKTSDTQSSPAAALTDWLKGQKGATPPAQPPVPGFPIVAAAPSSKMVVLYGSEVMEVEIPADGSPPINPTTKGFGMPKFGGPGLSGGALAPTPLPPVANPPSGGNGPPPGSNDSIDGTQQGSIDSNQDDQNGSIDGNQDGAIDGTQQGGIDSNQGGLDSNQGGSIDGNNGEFIEDNQN